MTDGLLRLLYFCCRGKSKSIITILSVAIVTVVFWKVSLIPGTLKAENDVTQEVTSIQTREHLFEKKFTRFCTNLTNNRSIQTRDDWDFKRFKIPKLSKEFKNPCYFDNITADIKKESKIKHPHCLPYFLIAGFPKAGTTDLWARLLLHPDVKLKHRKELNFFHMGRLKGTFTEMTQKYINIYDKSAMDLYRHVSPKGCSHEFPYYHGITGEGTVDAVFDNKFWPMFPGNEQCSEPVITNADVVYHVNPNIKVIFMLRNPVERLYSDYIYEARFIHYKTSPQLFHEAVVETIRNHTECRKHNTIRACAYNGSVETIKVRLRVGMYSTFIKDWYDVFPRQNILVLKSEDTVGPNRMEAYHKIFKFLDIRPYTRLEEQVIFKRGKFNVRTKKEVELGKMLPETRHLIEEFYKPFNKELTNMFPEIDYGGKFETRNIKH